MFETVLIGKNMRGLFTDLNIYSTFFGEQDMVNWTRGCEHHNGDIFSWDANKVNTTLEENDPKDVTIIKIDKNEICLDPNTKNIDIQKPSRSGGKIEKNRFNPRTKESS